MLDLQIANELLSAGCFKFSPKAPFEYASGLRGPIYCDNRISLSHPQCRDKIVEGFLKLFKESMEPKNIDFIAGLATGGIPTAAIMADRLKMPFAYVRSKPKGHGKGKVVEGDVKPGQSLLLVEDLVNQGASLDKSLKALKLENITVESCFCIVDYQTKASLEVRKYHQLQIHSLTTFSALTKVALEKKLIDQNDFDSINRWHEDPKLWSQNLD